jgi:hypothetical protein
MSFAVYQVPDIERDQSKHCILTVKLNPILACEMGFVHKPRHLISNGASKGKKIGHLKPFVRSMDIRRTSKNIILLGVFQNFLNESTILLLTVPLPISPPSIRASSRCVSGMIHISLPRLRLLSKLCYLKYDPF